MEIYYTNRREKNKSDEFRIVQKKEECVPNLCNADKSYFNADNRISYFNLSEKAITWPVVICHNPPSSPSPS